MVSRRFEADGGALHGEQEAAGGGAGGGGRAGRGGRQERAGLHQVRAEAAVSARPGAGRSILH